MDEDSKGQRGMEIVCSGYVISEAKSSIHYNIL